MSGLRPKVDEVEVVGHRTLVEFDADKFRQAFAVPAFANGVGRGDACLVVRMNRDLHGGAAFPTG